MVFVRVKWIPSGNVKRPYRYRVENYREKGKVKQRIIEYLGHAADLDSNPKRKRLTKADLYTIAKEKEIPNRSKMNRDELLKSTRIYRISRRKLKPGHKRIVVLRENVAYEITAKPRLQTERGKKIDAKHKAKTLIEDKELREFGWIGDTEGDVFEYNMAHYDELSPKEKRLVDELNKEIDRIEKYGEYEHKGALKISPEAKRIAKKKGITVIEAQHLLNRLEGKGIDSQTVDFESIDFESYEDSGEAFDEYAKGEAELSMEFYY